MRRALCTTFVCAAIGGAIAASPSEAGAVWRARVLQFPSQIFDDTYLYRWEITQVNIRYEDTFGASSGPGGASGNVGFRGCRQNLSSPGGTCAAWTYAPATGGGITNYTLTLNAAGLSTIQNYTGYPYLEYQRMDGVASSTAVKVKAIELIAAY